MKILEGQLKLIETLVTKNDRDPTGSSATLWEVVLKILQVVPEVLEALEAGGILLLGCSPHYSNNLGHVKLAYLQFPGPFEGAPFKRNSF